MNSVDICNMALSLLSRGNIISLEEDSEDARQCSRFYEITRKELLMEYRWSFAERYAKLAELDKEVPGWDHVYKYPSKCLMVRSVFAENDPDRIEDSKMKPEWKVVMMNDSTKAICTEVEKAYCRYTEDVTNGEMLTPWFVEALMYMLAAKMAMPLTGSQTTLQMMQQQAMQYLEYAKQHNAAEDFKRPVIHQGYFHARG